MPVRTRTALTVVVGLVALVPLLALTIGAGTGALHRSDRRLQLPAAGPAVVPAPRSVVAPAAARPVDVDRGGPVDVDPGWVARTAAASGVPDVALRAYARADLAAPASCHLGWTTLAGVGWVESQHGTLGGRTLDVDGLASTPILGPALDGTHHTKAVAATPLGTAEHGDVRWEHAVGPMQFLPATWAVWGADGDGDGVADPEDLDDAALAAAHYLCADGHDLATPAGWTAAVLSYNRSAAYLDDVHAAAETYAERTS